MRLAARESSMQRKIAAVFLTLALFAPFAPAPASPAPQNEKKIFDGAWWQGLGNWEQTGFMTGYIDCHAFEYRGTVAFTKPPQAYIDALISFYQQSAANKSVSASQALDRIREAGSETSGPPPAAGGPAPHGVYDGRFWFDAETPQVQLGFVEGYLACHAAKVKDADGHFSKSAEQYVSLINDAYGINDDTEDVDPQKGAQKIADVLHQLRDEASEKK
jgi:hypothetical protein